MKKIIAIVMLTLCTLMLFCACNAQPKSNIPDEKVIKITTPYADISVPEDFNGNVNQEVTSEEPYTMVFKAAADNTELFTLIFNGTGDILMGTLESDKGNIVIYMNIPDLDQNNPNYDTYCAYQEAVNTIMQHLAADYKFHINELIEDTTTYDIQTSIVTMKYPAKWKDKVQVEARDTGVYFSYNGTKLFDLIFSECDGFLLGTYKDTPIYIIDYPVETDEQAAMQEDVNVILQNLMEDKNFKINQ